MAKDAIAEDKEQIPQELIEEIEKAIPEEPDTRVGATKNTIDKNALEEIITRTSGNQEVIDFILKRLQEGQKRTNSGPFMPICKLSEVMELIAEKKNFKNNSTGEEAKRIKERKTQKLQAIGKKYIAYGKMLPREILPEGIEAEDSLVPMAEEFAKKVWEKRMALINEWIEIATASIILTGANQYTISAECSANTDELDVKANSWYRNFDRAAYDEKIQGCEHDFLINAVYAKIISRAFSMTLEEAKSKGLTDAENITATTGQEVGKVTKG